MTRDSDSGVVLVNVLVVIAIAATLVFALANSQDTALQGARNASATAQARAMLTAAESAAFVALDRDLRTAPETDHYAEPWSGIEQTDTELTTGRFTLEISDLRGKFDINRLTEPNVQDLAALKALLTLLDLPPELADRIATGLDGSDRLRDLAQLAQFGLGQTEITLLSPHVAALPVPGKINLNTADETLLTALMGNTFDVRRLVRLRDTQGFVTPGDLQRLGVFTPVRGGFASDLFEMTATATVDGSTGTLTSRFQRIDDGDLIEVRIIDRQTIRPDPSAVPSFAALFGQ